MTMTAIHRFLLLLRLASSASGDDALPCTLSPRYQRVPEPLILQSHSRETLVERRILRKWHGWTCLGGQGLNTTSVGLKPRKEGSNIPWIERLVKPSFYNRKLTT
jgi:hypothetical protein